jgi:hypothetical protein
MSIPLLAARRRQLFNPSALNPELSTLNSPLFLATDSARITPTTRWYPRGAPALKNAAYPPEPAGRHVVRPWAFLSPCTNPKRERGNPSLTRRVRVKYARACRTARFARVTLMKAIRRMAPHLSRIRPLWFSHPRGAFQAIGPHQPSRTPSRETTCKSQVRPDCPHKASREKEKNFVRRIEVRRNATLLLKVRNTHGGSFAHLQTSFGIGRHWSRIDHLRTVWSKAPKTRRASFGHPRQTTEKRNGKVE